MTRDDVRWRISTHFAEWIIVVGACAIIIWLLMGKP